MLPLIPFVAGIAVGAVAIKMYKSEKVGQEWERAKKKIRSSADTTREKLRDGTVQGLNRIEQSSARLREKLEDDAPEAKPKPRTRKTAKKSARTRSRKS